MRAGAGGWPCGWPCGWGVRVTVRNGHRVRRITPPHRRPRSWWRAAWTRRRFVILAAWSSGGHERRWSLARCGSRAAAHLWRPQARDGANAGRPRPARVGDRQAVQPVGRARNHCALSLVHALPGSRTSARSQAWRGQSIAGQAVRSSCAVELRCRAALSSCVVELCGRVALSSCVVELRCRALCC